MKTKIFRSRRKRRKKEGEGGKYLVREMFFGEKKKNDRGKGGKISLQRKTILPNGGRKSKAL